MKAALFPVPAADSEVDATFGQAVGADLALAQCTIADNALRFITQGLKDVTGRGADARLEGFSAQVRCRFLDRAAHGIPMKKEDSAKTRARAMASFHTAYQEHCDYLFGKVPPPWLGGCNEKDERASALKVLGVAPLEEPTSKKPLQLAFELAKFNRARSEQRITLLYLLGAVLRGHSSTLQPAAQAEFDAVSAYLWNARQQHTVRLLAMGTLLGGEALEENKALVKQMYGAGMSIMDLLQVDCVLPGRWLSSDEDKFRNALAKA